MLGRLQMGVDEYIDAYKLLSKDVFQKKRHRLNLRARIQGSFDSNKLAEAMKGILKQRKLPDDELLKDSANAKYKV
jgi:hypothetical protein